MTIHYANGHLDEAGGKAKRFKAAANSFARSVLLPERKFKKEVCKNGKILHLAKMFQTSTLLIRLRAQELGMKGHGL